MELVTGGAPDAGAEALATEFSKTFLLKSESVGQSDNMANGAHQYMQQSLQQPFLLPLLDLQ